MKIKSGVLIFSLTLITLIAGFDLYANPVFITSPVKESTANRFSGNADNFLSVGSYNDVEFDKIFSVISFNSKYAKFSRVEMAQLGFAVKTDNLYTGFYYGGNAWKTFGDTTADGNIYNYSERNINNRSMRVYSVFPEIRTDRFNLIYNEAAVLFGFADMGLRFSYATNYQSLNLTEDFGVGFGNNPDLYKSFYKEYGNINPTVTWGMAKDLLPGKGIKPSFAADFDFFRNSSRREAYLAGGTTNGQEVTFSGNYLLLGLTAGLGGYTLKEQDAFKLGSDFEYTVRMQMWNSEYSYRDENNNFHINKLKGGRVHNAVANSFGEDHQINHIITPSVNASFSADNLKLSARLGVPLTFWKREETFLGLKTGQFNGELVKNGRNDITRNYIVNPVFESGMKWEAIPGLFALNAGAVIDFGRVTLTRTDKKMFSQDVEISAEKVTRYSFEKASTELFLGICLTPTAKMELQAVCGVDTGNVINVFNTDPTRGFIAFTNILATVRY